MISNRASNNIIRQASSQGNEDGQGNDIHDCNRSEGSSIVWMVKVLLVFVFNVQSILPHYLSSESRVQSYDLPFVIFYAARVLPDMFGMCFLDR